MKIESAIAVIAICLCLFNSFLLFFAIKRIKRINPINKLLTTKYFISTVDSQLKKHRSDMAFIQLHISNFKFIVNIFGVNGAGNILKIFASCLNKYLIEKNELSGSAGADSFFIFVHFSGKQNIIERLTDFCNKFSEEARIKYPYRFVIKGGIVICKANQETIKTGIKLMSESIQALSSIKYSYKNEFIFYTETIGEKFLQINTINYKMQDSLYNGEFVPFYQPKIDIETGKINGSEALVRWVKDDATILEPDFFLPYFEQCGFIINIDYLILEKTCQNLQKRIQSGKRIVPVSCNFSRLHINDTQFPEKVLSIVQKYNVPPQLIEIEITETAILENQKILCCVFRKFHDSGFLVSIDDFGSGFSSLELLHYTNIDIIKLDKSLLGKGKTTEREQQILAAITKLCSELGLSVICEGVETEDHIRILKKIGCKSAQGFFYSKPLTAVQFEGLLDSEQDIPR